MKASAEDRELIVNTVRRFVDKEVIPVASEMERRDEYPDALVGQMERMGLFGLNVPEEYGGAEMDYSTFAMVFEELARGQKREQRTGNREQRTEFNTWGIVEERHTAARGLNT